MIVNTHTLNVNINPAGAQTGAQQVNVAINQMVSGSGRASHQFNSNINSMMSSFNRLTGAVRNLYALITTIAMVDVFKNFMARLIEVTREYQGFIAMMHVTTGTLRGAVAEYNFLYEASNRLGISVESATKTYAKLAASLKGTRLEGEGTRKLFESLSSAFVVMHAKPQDVELMMYAVTQMASKGVVNMEELRRQLGEKLPGTMVTAAKAMGMSMADFLKLVKSGTLDAERFFEAWVPVLDKTFGPSVQIAVQMLTARINVFRNTMFNLFKVVSEGGASEGMTKFVNSLIVKLNSAGASAEIISQKMNKFFSGLAAAIDSLSAKDITRIFDLLTAPLQFFVGLIENAIDKIRILGGGDATNGLRIGMEAVLRTVSAMLDLTVTLTVTLIQTVKLIAMAINGFQVINDLRNGQFASAKDNAKEFVNNWKEIDNLEGINKLETKISTVVDRIFSQMDARAKDMGPRLTKIFEKPWTMMDEGAPWTMMSGVKLARPPKAGAEPQVKDLKAMFSAEKAERNAHNAWLEAQDRNRISIEKANLDLSLANVESSFKLDKISEKQYLDDKLALNEAFLNKKLDVTLKAEARALKDVNEARNALGSGAGKTQFEKDVSNVKLQEDLYRMETAHTGKVGERLAIEQEIAKLRQDAVNTLAVALKEYDKSAAASVINAKQLNLELDRMRNTNTIDEAQIKADQSALGKGFGYGAIDDQLAADKAMIKAKYEEERAGIQLKIEAIQTGVDFELSTIDIVHQARMAAIEAENNFRFVGDADMLKASNDAKLAGEKAFSSKFNKLKIENETRSLAAVSALQKAFQLSFERQKNEEVDVERQASKGKLSLNAQYADLVGVIFTAVADTQDQSSRRGFETAKAFNTAAAIMSTAAAVMNALATVQPYPAAVVAAGLAAATGAIQIAAIQSTSFGGGGSVASIPSGAGAASTVGMGSSVSPPLTNIKDQQTGSQLDAIVESMGSASLAMGKAADSLYDISKAFEGGVQRAYLKTSPGIGVSNKYDDYREQFKLNGNMFESFNIAGAIGGFFTSGKWMNRAGGFTMGMDDGEFSGQSYVDQKKKRSWGRSSKSRTLYSDMDEGFSGMLSNEISLMISDIRRNAVAIGFSGAGFDSGLSQLDLAAAKIKTSGRTEEQIIADVQAQMLRIANAVAATLPGLSDFALYGEDLFDTVQRLGGALRDVNDQFALVGRALVESSAAGADWAYQLQELFGGSSEMAEAMDEYFEAMYTDSERSAMRAAAAQREVNRQFEEFEISVPTSISAFNELRNSVTDPELFAALTLLGPIFGEMINLFEDMAIAYKEFQDNVQIRYLNVTGRTGEAEILAMQLSHEAELREAREAGYDVEFLMLVQQLELAKLLESTVNEIYKSTVNLQIKAAELLVSILTGPMSTMSPEQQYLAQRQNFLDTQALADGGDVNAQNRLVDISREFLNLSHNYFASTPQYAADFDLVTRALADLAGMPSTDAISLETAIKQLDVLMSIRDILNGDVEGSYAVGTSSVPRDMVADIHQGEMIIDRNSAEVLRRYGIGVSGSSADNSATVAELREQNETLKLIVAKLTDIESPLRRVVNR